MRLEPGMKRLKIDIPESLYDHARRAAHAFGYTDPEDFSKFLCMAIADWVRTQESFRGDKAFPTPALGFGEEVPS